MANVIPKLFQYTKNQPKYSAFIFLDEDDLDKSSTHVRFVKEVSQKYFSPCLFLMKWNHYKSFVQVKHNSFAVVVYHCGRIIYIVEEPNEKVLGAIFANFYHKIPPDNFNISISDELINSAKLENACVIARKKHNEKQLKRYYKIMSQKRMKLDPESSFNESSSLTLSCEQNQYIRSEVRENQPHGSISSTTADYDTIFPYIASQYATSQLQSSNESHTPTDIRTTSQSHKSNLKISNMPESKTTQIRKRQNYPMSSMHFQHNFYEGFPQFAEKKSDFLIPPPFLPRIPHQSSGWNLNQPYTQTSASTQTFYDQSSYMDLERYNFRIPPTEKSQSHSPQKINNPLPIKNVPTDFTAGVVPDLSSVNTSKTPRKSYDDKYQDIHSVAKLSKTLKRKHSDSQSHTRSSSSIPSNVLPTQTSLHHQHMPSLRVSRSNIQPSYHPRNLTIIQRAQGGYIRPISNTSRSVGAQPQQHQQQQQQRRAPVPYSNTQYVPRKNAP